jgi:PAS domain S-box-containing protein
MKNKIDAQTLLGDSEFNLLNTALIGLALWHFDGQLMTLNPAFAQIMGRSVSETLPLNYWNDIVVEENFAAEQAALRALKVGERYGPVEKEYRHKDGYHVPVRLSALIMEIKGEYYAWSYVENITREKWQAIELQQAKQQAEKAHCAKNQFIVNMSHELRAAINTILGYTELFEAEIHSVDKAQLLYDTKNIHAATLNLQSLIDIILDVSKIEAGKMQLYLEQFDLRTMLQNVITTIRPLLENKANALRLVFDDDLGEMYTDSSKVRQIILNLLSNASKFTDQGIISLEVRRSKEKDGDWVSFDVDDDGIGMTTEEQNKLFEVFSQQDSMPRNYCNIGLGLAISKNFTQMLGGTIEVKSEFGQGSHFTLRLPVYISSDKQHRIDKVPRVLADVAMGGVVLVIDDDEYTRQLIELYLSKIGYQVALASNGTDGLKKAKQLRPDVIILDVIMPSMDGWQVLSKLKADSDLAYIPVIMLTMIEDHQMGYSLGAAEYLTKPISRNELLNILCKYCKDKPSFTILLVDDDRLTRGMMARVLDAPGWKIIEADNAKMALQLLQSLQPNLILSDLRMPEMDGFEFIKHLQQNKTWASIPVVVLTARDLTAEEHIWLNNNVDKVLQKGAYTRNELLSELRQLMVCRID